MAFFASGLALPFFLLALFPKWLQKLPRSGEWLARVKVVMGFLVLAFMLKYLYSLDAVLQLHLLTRERFLAAAVVLVAMAGFFEAVTELYDQMKRLPTGTVRKLLRMGTKVRRKAG